MSEIQQTARDAVRSLGQWRGGRLNADHPALHHLSRFSEVYGRLPDRLVNLVLRMKTAAFSGDQKGAKLCAREIVAWFKHNVLQESTDAGRATAVN